MTDWYVGPNVAKSAGSGTAIDPWNFVDAVDGTRTIAPGDRVLFLTGTYTDEYGTPPYDWDKRVYATGLPGTLALPIHLMPVPGVYARIDGAIIIDPGSSYVYLHDFEFYNDTPRPAVISPGSNPVELTAWGASGVAINNVSGCRIYNNVMRSGGGTLAIWAGASGAEIYGNICFGYGWLSSDRAHGHGIYVQNFATSDVKRIEHNIFGPGFYARQAKGQNSINAFTTASWMVGLEIVENLSIGRLLVTSLTNAVDEILVTGNIISSTRVQSTSGPDDGGCVCGNPLATDGMLTFTDNTLVNVVLRVANGIWATLHTSGIRIFKTVHDWWSVDPGTRPGHVNDEIADFFDVSVSGGVDESALWLNKYDSNRATLAIVDLDSDGSVAVGSRVSEFLSIGQTYRIHHFRDIFGTPVAQGTWNGSLTLDVIEKHSVDDVDATAQVDGFLIFKTTILIPDPPESEGEPGGTVAAERLISTPLRDAISAKVIAPILLYHANFPDVDVYGCTLPGRLDENGIPAPVLNWNGKNWLGYGGLVAIDPVQESTDSSADSLTVTVSGLAGPYYTPVILGDYHGRKAEVYLGAVDTATGVLLGDPYLLFAGTLDSDEIIDDGESANIRLTLISEVSDQLKARSWQYTHEDQQSLHVGAGDDGLEFVAALQDAEIA